MTKEEIRERYPLDKKMYVKDLIKQLQKFDDDTEVEILFHKWHLGECAKCISESNPKKIIIVPYSFSFHELIVKEDEREREEQLTKLEK